MNDDLVDAFLLGSQRNQWLCYPDKEIYVRKGHHYYPPEDKIILCFDIASIEVHPPHTGIFTKFLSEMIIKLKDSEYKAIFVESVLNKSFAGYLRRHSWFEMPGIDKNFFLIL